MFRQTIAKYEEGNKDDGNDDDDDEDLETISSSLKRQKSTNNHQDQVNILKLMKEGSINPPGIGNLMQMEALRGVNY